MQVNDEFYWHTYTYIACDIVFPSLLPFSTYVMCLITSEFFLRQSFLQYKTNDTFLKLQDWTFYFSSYTLAINIQ